MIPQPPPPKWAPPADLSRDKVTDPNFYDALQSAITAWNSMTAEQQKNNMTDFCKERGLKRQTFSAYVREINPRKLGVRPGRPQLLTEQDERFITDVIIMNDHAKLGSQCAAWNSLLRNSDPVSIPSIDVTNCYSLRGEQTMRRSFEYSIPSN